MEIEWGDFEKIHIQVSTIIEASILERARKPAFKLLTDLGEDLGIKKSSAQITFYYNPKELIGKQVVCVTNFPIKNIAGWES